MVIKFESYTTGDNQIIDFFGATWKDMSFTPDIAHDISLVTIKIFRTGSPGTITVSIRATSSGLPTGNDLTSGTTDGNTITTSVFGALIEFDLTPYSLEASTEYAIVVRVPDGDGSNYLNWRRDTTGTYAGGGSGTSTDSGGSWAEVGGGKPDGTTVDYLFEEWGELIVPSVPTIVSITSGSSVPFTPVFPFAWGKAIAESDVLPPLDWPGTRPEYLVFLALEGLGLKEGTDFQYQSSQQGGRMERGGAVLDFFLPALQLGLNVASLYWHYGRPERVLNDRLQRESLEGAGIRVIYRRTQIG